MKKTKTRLILLGTLFLLISLVFLSTDYITSLSRPKTAKPFSHLTKEDISHISIKKDSQIDIVKNANTWIVKKNNTDYPADIPTISNIIDGIINLEKKEIASTNKAKHQDLGIGTHKVDIKSKNDNITLYIGETTGNADGYVRIGDENEVFVASGLSDIFMNDEYRDLSPHMVDNENNVTHISLIHDNTELTLEKQKDSWRMNGTNAIREQVDYFINDLKTLRGNEMLIMENMTDVLPEMTVTIKENSIEKTAQFYLKDEEHYYLKVSHLPFTYQIPSTVVDNIKKENDYFTE